MARVRLSRREAMDGDLPPVCMRCGAPSDLVKSKTFSWNPSWVWVLILCGLLPFLIVALVLTKRMRVRAPLCQAHAGHWAWRSWFIMGGLVVVVILGIAAGVAVAELDRQPRLRNVGGYLCVGVAVFALIWLVAAAIIQANAIGPAEITDRDITLVRVAPEFADALRRERRRYDEEDEDYRRPRPRHEDEDEDEWEPRR
jgi:hypothetical protein